MNITIVKKLTFERGLSAFGPVRRAWARCLHTADETCIHMCGMKNPAGTMKGNMDQCTIVITRTFLYMASSKVTLG